MNKWMLVACVIALAAPVGRASAESGDDRGRDFLAQGMPSGDYKINHDKDDHKKPPHPPHPCKPHDHDGDRDDQDCGNPASR